MWMFQESELECVILALQGSVPLGHRKSDLKMRESILGIRIHALGNMGQHWVEEASVTQTEGLTARPD